MKVQLKNALVILRRKQVEARTGLSKSSIYAKLKFNPKRPADFDASFPKPICLGSGVAKNSAVGWVESEIDGWIAAQILKSRKSA